MPRVGSYVQRSINVKNIKGQFISKTDIGLVRMINEDRAISLVNAYGDVLLCVCDGLGGHNKGDYASELAVSILSETFRDKIHFHCSLDVRFWIYKVLNKINRAINEEASHNEKYADMGTTIVLTILHGNKIYTAYAGDSRAYSVLNRDLLKLTSDQTYVEYLYQTGQIKKEEMATSQERHKLINALGTYPSVSYSIIVKKNEFKAVLLCSDGLYNNANDSDIKACVTSDERVEQKVDTLIGIAKSNGGSDNIAISYWERNSND